MKNQKAGDKTFIVIEITSSNLHIAISAKKQ